ncbi:hypothetical protein [Anaerovibrio lipolyticus]|nr:hypothetical protein [Anaerovibrio lipolyticus]
MAWLKKYGYRMVDAPRPIKKESYSTEVVGRPVPTATRPSSGGVDS